MLLEWSHIHENMGNTCTQVHACTHAHTHTQEHEVEAHAHTQEHEVEVGREVEVDLEESNR